jgi:hypothetical protein
MLLALTELMLRPRTVTESVKRALLGGASMAGLLAIRVLRSVMPASRSCCSLIAVTFSATLCAALSRLVALTTTVSSLDLSFFSDSLPAACWARLGSAKARASKLASGVRAGRALMGVATELRTASA